MTVSQSVCLGVEPRLGLMNRYLLLLDSYGHILRGAPSLTRGRVCLVPESVNSHSQLSVIYIYLQFQMINIFLKDIIMQYIQGLCPSGPGTADYVLFPVAFATTAVLGT
jgi:hypothetical protein